MGVFYTMPIGDDLPIIEARVDENDTTTGVLAVSLVDIPAIQAKWVAYSANGEANLAQFVETPNERQMLTGPLLIPEQKIYRKDDKGNEYYIQYSEDVVRKAAHKYMRTGGSGQTSTMHKRQNDRVKVVESWVVDNPSKDKAASMGFRVPRGTWMVTVKVDDTAYWNRNIKTGKLTGFSLEGFFTHSPQKVTMKSNELASMLSEASPEERKALRQALEQAEKPQKKGFFDQLSAILGVKQAEDKQKEEMAMQVMLPDGTGIELPDSNEVDVTDAEGNVVGKIVFVPAEVAPVEAPQDGEEPVENPEDVALRAEVTELRAIITEMSEALTKLASQAPSVAVKQAAVKPAGSQAKKPSQNVDSLPGEPNGEQGWSIQGALKRREERKTANS